MRNPNAAQIKGWNQNAQRCIKVVACSSRYSIALNQCGGCRLCTKQISRHEMIECMSKVA